MPSRNADIHIFFDDGNVLNDNRVRGHQWQELIGDFLTPRFGGTREAWGEANTNIMQDFISKGIPTLMYEHKEKTHQEFMKWFREKWINDMFDHVGIERPNQTEYDKLYYETAKYVDLRVRSAFPGVETAVKTLHERGYNLYTASGTESIELNYYLKGMGLRRYFQKLFGPDLINVLKVDGAYYQAIFEDIDISSSQAIVIDDKPYYLKIAKKVGAQVIQASLTGEFKPQSKNYITKMNDLPMVVEKLKRSVSKTS